MILIVNCSGCKKTVSYENESALWTPQFCLWCANSRAAVLESIEKTHPGIVDILYRSTLLEYIPHTQKY